MGRVARDWIGGGGLVGRAIGAGGVRVPRVAALTMIYNEPVWARVWVRHYARQVGAAHCFVLDHGSDDGSTTGLGVAVELLARTPLDEDARAELISERVRVLLRDYDAVVHTDADELLVADPAAYPDLVAYAAVAPGVATAIGLDLQHLPDVEPGLDATLPLGGQRRWVRFSAAMCKPALVREAVRWTPGFHGCDGDRAFGGLYLIHLRYADLSAGLARLRRTRSQAFARADVNLHQRVPDAAFEAMVRAIGQLPRVEGDLSPGGAVLEPWLTRMRAGWARGDGQLALAGDALWSLPAALRARL